MVQSNAFLDLRSEIDRLLEAGSAELAAASLRELWRNQHNLATAAFICSRYEKLRGKLNLIPHRLAILRSFTVEPLLPCLRADAFCFGLDLAVHVGDFNAYSQEILDPASSLYKFLPHSVILAARTADIAPELWERYPDLPPEEVQNACTRVSSSFARLITAFRGQNSAALIIHNLEQPVRPSAGIIDSQ